MNCPDVQALVHAHVDKELDLLKSIEVERHLDACEQCAHIYQQQATLRSLLQEHTPDFSEPESLRARIESSLPARGAGEKVKPRLWNWPSIAAALTVAVVVTWALTYFLTRTPAEEGLTDDAISAHMRSLIANHLTDVVSSDSRSVEAWFRGRLAFLPPVRDMRASGYTLVGGRLDYLYKRPVAVLVYRHGEHLINVFVWPANKRDEFPEQVLRDDGFHIMFWTRSGTNYCAISDLGQRDFLEFVRVYWL